MYKFIFFVLLLCYTAILGSCDLATVLLSQITEIIYKIVSDNLRRVASGDGIFKAVSLHIDQVVDCSDSVGLVVVYWLAAHSDRLYFLVADYQFDI